MIVAIFSLKIKEENRREKREEKKHGIQLLVLLSQPFVDFEIFAHFLLFVP